MYFGVDTAQLDEINRKLEKTLEVSEKINGNLKIDFNIDTKGISTLNNDVEKSLNKIKVSETENVKYTEAQIRSMGVTLNKENSKRITSNVRTAK